MKVIVCHAYYGCETGCCGHIVRLENEENGKFKFAHNLSSESTNLEFAMQLVVDRFGADHTYDLDWDNCLIIDD